MVVKGIIPEQCRLRTAQQRSRAASRFQLRCRQNWPWQRARQNAVGLQLQHILSMLILLQLTKPTQSCHITNFLVHQGLQSKTEGRMQPKHDLNLCGIFFPPPVGRKNLLWVCNPNVSHCVLQGVLQAHTKYIYYRVPTCLYFYLILVTLLQV